MKPDVQQNLRLHVVCTDYMERWIYAAKYLHDIGDTEAALDALREAQRWRDRKEELEPPIRRRPQ